MGNKIRFTLGGFKKPEKEACEDFAFTTYAEVGNAEGAANNEYTLNSLDQFSGIIYTVTRAQIGGNDAAVSNDPCVVRTVEPFGTKYVFTGGQGTTPYVIADIASSQGFQT